MADRQIAAPHSPLVRTITARLTMVQCRAAQFRAARAMAVLGALALAGTVLVKGLMTTMAQIAVMQITGQVSTGHSRFRSSCGRAGPDWPRRP
jgi:hypothetical protein